MSWKEWDQGEIVEAGDFQEYIQDQVVQSYANASERNTTLGASVAEGMISYREDANVVEVYDGTNWVQVGEGTITEVVAGTALTGGGTSGSVTLNADVSALATAHAGNALNANGDLLDVDESEINIDQSQVTDLTTDLSNKASTTHATTHESGGSDEIEIAQSQVTGLDAGTEGFTALSNGTSGLSYQPVSHNYIINGAFDIWQRGDSITTDSDAPYGVDRFKVGRLPEGNATMTKESFNTGDIEAIGFGDAEYFARTTFTTGTATGADQLMTTRLEDVRTLAGSTATISFYAKVGSGTEGLSPNYVQRFGSGGSSAVTANFTTVTLTTSWQRFTGTVAIPSIAGKTIGTGNHLEIRFQSDGFTTGNTFDIWGVQLEAGSIATPFKRNANSIAGELAACQRYYCRIKSDRPFAFFGIGQVVATDDKCLMGISLPTTMRATPSLSFSPISTFTDRAGQVSLSSFSVDGNTVSPNNATIDVKITSGNKGEVFTIIGNNSTDAFIEAKAEL